LAVISSIICSSSEEFLQVVFDQQGAPEYAQYLCHGPSKLEVMLDDCNEAVCDDGNMNLYPDSILGVTPERLDLEMLFEPFEEKFHLPTVAVKQGNVLGREVEVVGVVDERLLKIGGIVDNSSEFSWVIPSVSTTGETDCLVKQDVVFSIDSLVSVSNLEFWMPLLADDEECSALMYGENSGEVEISPVEYVYSIGLIPDTVHELGVMHVGIGNAVEYGYLRGDVNLGVDFDAGLCAAKMRPTEDGHTEVDCSGIDSIETPMKLKLLGDSTLLGKRHHIESEFLEDSRLAEHSGFRQGVPDDGRRTKSEIERPFSMSSCYICKFPETSATYELSEHEHKQVVPMGETPSLGPVRILRDNSPELPLWQAHCDLSKNVASCMHNRSDFDSDHNIHISKVGHKFCCSKRYA